MQHARKKIVLHAGDYCFGGEGTHVHTLLGSCVSITLWHPQRRIGGMCHFALPRQVARRDDDPLDPRYAEDCIALFQRSAERQGTRLTDYRAKVFGGGNMYEHGVRDTVDGVEVVQRQPVGDRNAAAAFTLLMQAGIEILVGHVGEYGYRRLVFDIGTGDVWVRFSRARGVAGDLRALQGRS